MKKYGFRLMRVAVLAVLVAGCAKKEEPPAAALQYLVLGTNAEFPPFVTRAEAGGPDAGEIIGFDVEIALAIADKAGLPLKVENLEFDRLLPALAAGEVDLVLAALPITAARRKLVNFSAPYYDATPMAVVLAGGPVPETREELKEMRLGAPAGSAGLAAAEEIAGAGEVPVYASIIEAVAALRGGQVDGILLDSQVAVRYTDRNELLMRLAVPFEKESYGVAVRKGNAELLAQVNEVLAQIVADGRHTQWLDALVIGETPATE